MKDDSGNVFAEYVIVLSAVSVGCVIAIIALGVPLVELFQLQQAWLLLPFP